jgi:uncharacterized Zn finger protein
LACPSCSNEYVLRRTEDDDPVLQCVYCNMLVQPGWKMYNKVQAVVKEFYL